MQRILLVEDEEGVARALERWLVRQGAEVRVLLDPLQVGEVVRSFQPTLVISDLHMPTRSGIEVLTEVKTLAPATHRALLSGSLHSVSADDLVALQPVTLINKPWNVETLARDLGLDG